MEDEFQRAMRTGQIPLSKKNKKSEISNPSGSCEMDLKPVEPGQYADMSFENAARLLRDVYHKVLISTSPSEYEGEQDIVVGHLEALHLRLGEIIRSFDRPGVIL